MKKTLKQIAEIQIGFQHRGLKIERADGHHPIVQIKDVGEEGQIDFENLERVPTKGAVGRYKVRKGDVLFQTRGKRFCAMPILSDLRDTLAAYVFFIVRSKISEVHPEYLAWFINQPPAQKFLEKRAVGTAIRMLKKPAFEELEVDLPPLDTQTTIIQLENLRRREEIYTKQIASLRGSLVRGACLQAARETDNRTGVHKS